MAPRWVKALLVAVVMVAAVAPLEAVPVIRFDNFVDTGTLEYDTVGGTLTGTNIGFDFIVATDTPLNSGTFNCLGCTLNFETGLNTLNGPANYAWAPGGTFVITGEIPGVTAPNATLLTGTFTSATAVGTNIPGSGADILVFTGIGFDTKDLDLLAFFGLSPDMDFRFASTDISTTATINANGTFTANVDEADVTNTAVPEPGSLTLLLLGATSLAAYRRRRG